MDTTRVSFGEMLAGAGGLVILVCMFLPWFDGTLSGRNAPVVPVDTMTGWESFGSVFDLAVVVLAGVPIAVAVRKAAGAAVPLPAEQSTLVLAAGALLLLVVAVRVADAPGLVEVPFPNLEVDVSRRLGALVAPLAALAVVVGGWAQGREAALRR